MFQAMRAFLDKGGSRRIKLTWAGVSSWDIPRIAEEMGVRDHLQSLGYVDHRTACQLMRKHHLLWVLVGTGEGPEVSTAKAYEYLGAKRSLFITSPKNTDAARLVFEHGGYWAPADDPQAIASSLETAWQHMQRGEMLLPAEVEPYSAKTRTESLAETIREVLNG